MKTKFNKFNESQTKKILVCKKTFESYIGDENMELNGIDTNEYKNGVYPILKKINN